MKKIIQKVIAIVLAALSFLGLFLENFISGKLDTSILETKPTYYNFQDWFTNMKDLAEVKELTWMPIAEYALYAALAFAGLIIIIVIFQFFVKNKAFNTITKIISILGILVGAVALLTLFLGCNEVNDFFSTELGSIKYSLEIGAYIIPLGTMAGGILGLFCTNKIKKSKKRR